MSTAIESSLRSPVAPPGLGDFPNTHTTAALFRAYLWGKRNQDRLAISGQMALSNVTRELQRRGLQLPQEARHV